MEFADEVTMNLTYLIRPRICICQVNSRISSRDWNLSKGEPEDRGRESSENDHTQKNIIACPQATDEVKFIGALPLYLWKGWEAYLVKSAAEGVMEYAEVN